MRKGSVCKEQNPTIPVFQYSLGNIMDNAKNTEVFCAFFLHFFPKRSVAIRWQVQHQQKGSKNKSKNSELQDTELTEKLNCFKLWLVTFTSTGPVQPRVTSTVTSEKSWKIHENPGAWNKIKQCLHVYFWKGTKILKDRLQIQS